MYKKIGKSGISLVLVMLMFCCSIVSAFASTSAQNENSPPQFYVSSESVLIGETISVEVGIRNNPGITAFQLKLEYDENYLTLTNIDHCTLFSNSSTSSNKYSNPFKISWFSQQSLDETCDGTIAVLTFLVNKDATKGSTKINLSYDADNVFNSNFENITFETVSGDITIVDFVPGDINDDKTVNMKDIVLLQQHLNGFDVNINSKAADVYFDSAINMKDIALLQKYLNGYDITLGEKQEQQPNGTSYDKFVYGKSEMGKDLVCYSFTPESYTNTVLLNFAIHGYEDEYAADGQVLVDTANKLIEYYNTNKDKWSDTRLLIVPCANPDGLYDGYTNNGFGRCNANGIDLNRDFDANYISRTDARYYTPYAFSASESRALRDLVNEYSADVVIDFHGWLNYTIGDYELAQVFYEEMGLSHYVSFTGSNAGGYFANWAHQQGVLGLLVEFTNSRSVSVDRLVSATNRILQNDYVVLDKVESFKTIDTIDCYTLSTGRVTTYQFVDKPFDTTSYIDGTTDKTTILDVYDNGWVKVQYPLYNGTNKTAYCYLSDFISPDEMVEEFYEYTVSANTYVYRRSDMAEQFGTVYPTDKITVVAEKDNMLQIIYPLDNGGYKMGWIQNNN